LRRTGQFTSGGRGAGVDQGSEGGISEQLVQAAAAAWPDAAGRDAERGGPRAGLPCGGMRLAEGCRIMAELPALGFADLLRQLRAEAQLTQEELAEAAKLSPRSVSDLERSIHPTARKDTAVLLAGALGLAEPVRSLFVVAAVGRIPAAQVLAAIQQQAQVASSAAATRALPSDIASFTGRERELALLLAALTSQAWALNDLGVVHQQAADYDAAAASHQQALDLFRDIGNQLGQAVALNDLGQLAVRTATAGPLTRARHQWCGRW
jgi:transcriptional regulator with XRE-family HTH domain